ncbi:MAG TPA: VIT1/CCC1 transporter family protein [Acidimicrobiales bacterium]|nr:VIT1/CCC1 transporter family protein [Acidimicrobiales bacterium]
MTQVGRPVRPGQPTTIPIDANPGDEAGAAAELAGRVAEVSKGAARAAVLGVNDGLVTNVCLILAVAGASASSGAVRLAGFASLLAGAFSMAAGEWVSVRSQVELYRSLIGALHSLIARNPRVVLDELTGRLEDAGFGRTTAQRAATELPLDEGKFLRFATTTIFGIDQESLGSPLTAASTSLLLFAAGALVPLLPWFFLGGAVAVAVSVAATAAASLVVGAYVARSSDRPLWAGAGRQLLIVAAASAVTFGIGHLFGAAVS